MMRIYVQAIWVWVSFYVIAVLNGLLRDAVYVPGMGATWGRVVGALVLIVLMLAVMYFFLRRHRARLNRGHLALVGLVWVALSAFFELGVSHYVLEIDWQTLLAHYSIVQGPMRLVLLLVELVGPFVIGSRLLRGEAAGEEAPAEAPTSAPSGSDDAG